MIRKSTRTNKYLSPYLRFRIYSQSAETVVSLFTVVMSSALFHIKYKVSAVIYNLTIAQT